MELDRTIYMRVEPFIVLIDRWRRNGVEINFEQEKRSRVVLVVPVGNFQHNLYTVGAVDKPLVGEALGSVLIQ